MTSDCAMYPTHYVLRQSFRLYGPLAEVLQLRRLPPLSHINYHTVMFHFNNIFLQRAVYLGKKNNVQLKVGNLETASVSSALSVQLLGFLGSVVLGLLAVNEVKTLGLDETYEMRSSI